MFPLGMWFMFFATQLYYRSRGDFYIQQQKKGRIYTAFGVSQTPIFLSL